MKKYLLLLIAVILLSCFASAIEMQDNVFLEDEAVIVVLDELDVQQSEVRLYDWNNTEFSSAYLIRNVRDFSIIVFDAPVAGTYTFSYLNETLPFTVEEGEGLECVPQYFYLAEGDSFNIQLRYSNGLVTIAAEDVSPIRESIQVTGSATLEIRYNLTELKKDTTIELTYGNRTYKYMIFVQDIEEAEEPAEESPVEEPEAVEGELVFLVDEINQEAKTNIKLQSYIPFKNDLTIDLAVVSFEVTGTIAAITELEYGSIDLLESGEESSILVTVNKDRDVEAGEYSGDLVMKSGDYEARLPMYVLFTEETEEVEFPEVDTTDDLVVSIPEEEEEKDNRAFYVGIAILFILVCILIYLWWKLRMKPRKEFKDVVRERGLE